MGKIIQYLQEVKGELVKVVWPNRKDAARITWIVIIFSVIVAAFLSLVDFGLLGLIERIGN